jgi:hypothetical protein
MVRIRCHFDGKTLVPDEPVDLPHGQHLVALVATVPDGASGPQHCGSDDQKALKPFFEWAAENTIDDPTLPDDLTRNLDHYLYGAAKREE